jgi:hypothetical protein
MVRAVPRDGALARGTRRRNARQGEDRQVQDGRQSESHQPVGRRFGQPVAVKRGAASKRELARWIAASV